MGLRMSPSSTRAGIVGAALAAGLAVGAAVHDGRAATTAAGSTSGSAHVASSTTRTRLHRRTARHPAAVPSHIPLGAADTTSAYTPQLYLSWRQPYGMPGASDTLTIVPGDTTRIDTLFLSFDPGRDAPRFFAMSAQLDFHPQPGDTLGPYWQFQRGMLRMEFDPDGTYPCPQPWIAHGFGVPTLQFDPGRLRLDMIFAVRVEDTAPVAAGTRYCFGRVMLVQKHCRLPGASQPVCIEFAVGRMSFGGPDVITSEGPQRWVTVNARDGGVCSEVRHHPAPEAWRPKVDTGTSPSPPSGP
jgi:hypothetical protein